MLFGVECLVHVACCVLSYAACWLLLRVARWLWAAVCCLLVVTWTVLLGVWRCACLLGMCMLCIDDCCWLRVVCCGLIGVW